MSTSRGVIKKGLYFRKSIFSQYRKKFSYFWKTVTQFVFLPGTDDFKNTTKTKQKEKQKTKKFFFLEKVSFLGTGKGIY